MLLTARETAELLGVKLDTLYAYVSRGLIRSVDAEGSRERRYEADEVERFRAGRGMRGRPLPEVLMPVIGSAVCLIEDHHIYYRGHDALRLADEVALEDIAALLWQDDVAALPAARVDRLRQPMGEGAGLIERCQFRLAGFGAADLAALDLSRAGVVRTGRVILDELAAAVAGGETRALPVHRRLGEGWRLDPAGADVVRRCLVLLADHELNASTFVARCIASTGATPYAVVAGALAALSGRRHGGASAQVEAMFREMAGSAEPMPALAARLARGDAIPGLGQPLYPKGDPRAPAIIAALSTARPKAGAHIAAAAAAATELTGQHPNVDFALGAAAVALELPPGAALGIFLVARSVGWIAHAIEQYESGVLIRPRARYIGRRPALGTPL